MKNKMWLTAVISLSLFIITACFPTEIEPGLTDLNQTATPPSLPTPIPPPTTQVDTAVSPTPPSIPYPLHPDVIPNTLPVYIMTPDPIPAVPEEALTWAQSFGFIGLELAEANNEMLRLLKRDEAAGRLEELTFLRTTHEQLIIYSSGVDWQYLSGATPQPTAAVPSLLPPETVTNIALEFVREHHLLPEPLIAHEFPGTDDRYLVYVTTALSGLRLTNIGEVPGVKMRIEGNGRVTEARIIPASFAEAATVDIQPLNQVYAGFMQGDIQNIYYYERAHFGSIRPLDYLRYQAHSLPYGEAGDRVEMVYAPLPLQPERLVPMWLITRPYDQTWDHFVEYYLPATSDERVPRPIPSPTPLAHTDIVPDSLQIVPQRIVNGENGRLYTNAVVDGITHTVSLDAVSGSLSAVFGLTGDLALDTSRNLLYVDKYPYGLTVIDTTTNEPINDIQLPSGENGHARPHADPAAGNVLLFRDQMLLVADPLSESWQQTVPFTVEGTVCGEPMEQPPPIQQTWFDEESRLLYLTLADYVCTPWVSYTLIVYDLNTMSEVTRYPQIDYMSGVAVNGRFYAKSWFRLGKTFQWAWQNGQPWLEQIDRGEDFVGGFSGFQVDENRGRLYEMTVDGLQVLDMETMVVIQTVPAPVDGQLVGFDPVTDQLYFVDNENGRLYLWPASNLK